MCRRPRAEGFRVVAGVKMLLAGQVVPVGPTRDKQLGDAVALVLSTTSTLEVARA
jgi:hypothetical protein